MDIVEKIKKLKIEEKMELLTGKNPWTSLDMDHIGLEAIWLSDGPHGLRRKKSLENQELNTSICYPTASALAATWNVDAVNEVGKSLGEECQALGVDILLGPGVNIIRNPLCGRNFEYFSEDPLLAGELGAAYIMPTE